MYIGRKRETEREETYDTGKREKVDKESAKEGESLEKGEIEIEERERELDGLYKMVEKFEKEEIDLEERDEEFKGERNW